MTKRRKKYMEEVKARVALEAIKGIRTLSEPSATYGVHPTVIAQWKRQLIKGAVEVFNRSNPARRIEQELTAPLYEEIGRFKMEIDWLKKCSERVAGGTARWIEPKDVMLSIVRQCALAGLSRSSYYYEPLGTETDENLDLMRVIDRLYLKRPFYGAPHMTDWLRSWGSDQSQAGRAADASNGFTGDIAGTAHQPGASRAPYLPRIC